MVFNSLTFLVFFAVLLVLHRLPFSWTTKKVNLLLASYVFYAAWNPPFILLLWASTVVDCTGERATILRAGAIAPARIAAILDDAGIPHDIAEA